MQKRLSRRKFIKSTSSIIFGSTICGTSFTISPFLFTNKAKGSIVSDIFSNTPDFIKRIPDQILNWQRELCYPDYFGLSKDCVDSEIPFSFPASGVMLRWLKEFGMFEKIPGYSKEAVKRTAEYVLSCQQEDTGLVIDPYMDKQFTNKGEEAILDFRRAVTKYTNILLNELGYELRYPYSQTGDSGIPDGNAFLQYVKTADWDKPWGTGSHAGGMAREILYAINEGHEELIPELEKGTEVILSHQNPETGMIGRSEIPLHEQISGSLKVYPRLLMYMGLKELPYIDRLADSCIKHHINGGFYKETDDILIARNLLEMCGLCLEFSDYRKDELSGIISSSVDRIFKHRMPDGLYASSPDGKSPIGWCGAHIASQSDTPRSNINGTQAAIYSFGLAGKYLDWKDNPLKYPLEGWQENVAKMKYRIELQDDGKVKVVLNYS